VVTNVSSVSRPGHCKPSAIDDPAGKANFHHDRFRNEFPGRQSANATTPSLPTPGNIVG
jgi:hypothetical protein